MTTTRAIFSRAAGGVALASALTAATVFAGVAAAGTAQAAADATAQTTQTAADNAAAAPTAPQGAPAATDGGAPHYDLRKFYIGMPVSELPIEGYGNFACGGDGGPAGAALKDWSEFKSCPPEASGYHEVRFDYTATRVAFVLANEKWEGTRVYGHPVLLSLLIDDDAVVRGIRIITDPTARAYMHKKAFLLGERAKYRFSPATWNCVVQEPTNGEQPIGGVYYNERCENRFDDRLVKMSIQLYREKGQGPKEFVNGTRLEIFGADEE